MIGVDWGTSSLRAWRIARDGSIIDHRASRQGIMTVGDRGFEAVLRKTVSEWLAAGETRILLSGMIGSRQGWKEARYVACPAGIDELATQMIAVGFDGADVRIVPGIATTDSNGVPEVMRGEETQILGVVEKGDAVVCLPGTHSKWATVAGGRIEGFETFMTGEIFAALSEHTILARTMQREATNYAAFDEGLVRARDSGGLLHHAFGVRTRVLRGGMDEAAASSYLSGLLIGHEMNGAMKHDLGPIRLIGADGLTPLYARAIESRGGAVIVADEATVARGLVRMGDYAGWH